MASNSNSKRLWEYDNEKFTAEINVKYVTDPTYMRKLADLDKAREEKRVKMEKLKAGEPEEWKQYFTNYAVWKRFWPKEKPAVGVPEIKKAPPAQQTVAKGNMTTRQENKSFTVDSRQSQTRGRQETIPLRGDSRPNQTQTMVPRENMGQKTVSRANQNQNRNEPLQKLGVSTTFRGTGGKLADSAYAPGNEHVVNVRKRKNFDWSEEPPQKVTSIDHIQQEQEREKKRQRRPQSQRQTASEPKGMYRADGERMYSVRPPLQARYLSFLSAGKENRGAALKWCESALGVVISHDYRKDIEFIVYATPKQYEQWTDPKVKLKLEAAEEFLRYWADDVQWYLENKESVSTIDEILDEYLYPSDEDRESVPVTRTTPAEGAAKISGEKVASVAETPASREDKSTAKGRSTMNAIELADMNQGNR